MVRSRQRYEARDFGRQITRADIEEQHARCTAAYDPLAAATARAPVPEFLDDTCTSCGAAIRRPWMGPDTCATCLAAKVDELESELSSSRQATEEAERERGLEEERCLKAEEETRRVEGFFEDAKNEIERLRAQVEHLSKMVDAAEKRLEAET